MGYDHIPARLFAYTDGCEDSWVNLFVVQKSIVALFFKHGFDEVIFARTAQVCHIVSLPENACNCQYGNKDYSKYH